MINKILGLLILFIIVCALTYAFVSASLSTKEKQL